jgi:hypothetical protein
VIGQHEQRRIAVDLRQHLAEHLIDLLVKFFERCSVLSGERGVVRGTLRIGQPPHHVRVQIEARKIKEEQALVKFWELGIERPPMFGEHGVRLFQIFFIVEHARGERLRVFGNALGVEFADLFRQVASNNSKASRWAEPDFPDQY